MTFAAHQPDRLLRLPELKPITAMGKSRTYEEIKAGRFPKPVKLGRLSAWSEAEIRAWVEARKAERNAA